MSAAPPSTSTAAAASATKSKKKNKKKKGAVEKLEANGESKSTAEVTSTHTQNEDDLEDTTDQVNTDDQQESPIAQGENEPQEVEDPASPSPGMSASVNGLLKAANTHITPTETYSDAQDRLEALARERDALKAEVIQLRKSLESIQEQHCEETSSLRDELDEATAGKEQAETQYNDLLGRVNSIRAQLGERLKSYSEELAQSRSQIEELEEQNRSIQEHRQSLQAEVLRLKTESLKQETEISELRSRGNLSQQNWIKERDELIQREAYAREEFETAKQAMQDWELLAMEERAQRQSLSDRVAELEEQLAAQQDALDRTSAERDTHAEAVDGLQRALREIQEARKKELRELVEKSQHELDALRKQLQVAEESATHARTELEMTKSELDHAMPFEKEVKEKNLLIRKLRHEAVILNDHLTKALRFLKQRKPEDMVDRQLVTNHFLHFITLDRTDPKKFQVLQLIAALLAWTDEEKEQAGLSRPGSSFATGTASLKLPLPTFRRSPSQPSLNTGDLSPDARPPSSRESLAELWSDFLEREAEEGSKSRTGSRSAASVSSPSTEPRESGA